MKIRVKKLSPEEFLALPAPHHKKPGKPSLLFRTVMKLAAVPELHSVDFRCKKIGMEKLAPGTPCLYLMNHSSFIDLKIVASLLYPHPFQIVCTSDGFVGKEFLMRSLGCIPTRKFTADPVLVRDMAYALRKNHASVVLYPEASYSFDGTATPLPDTIGPLCKRMRVPVVMIRTYGAFARDPLYNGLRLRRVPVTAEMTCLYTAEELQNAPAEEIQRRIEDLFTFDHFRWQRETNTAVTEPFRAEGLERVLYKCRACGSESTTHGHGTTLTCGQCGASWEMDEYGTLRRGNEAVWVPEWYRWEREAVRGELERGMYRLDIPVRVCGMRDFRAVYDLGTGRLVHDADGFFLTCGAVTCRQRPMASYSLYADYFWYELGDMICIADRDSLYYCFPQTDTPVAKARLAAEELYKLEKAEKSGVR